MEKFKNQKVGVLGLGEENVALVKYLVKQGANVVVCDQKEKGELGEYYQQVKDLPVQFRLGPHYLEHLEDFSIIFRTPGIPYFNEKIQAAKDKGVEISSLTKLFFELCPCPIIGVTGTKGKGTTASLIYEILKSKTKAFLGGNIGTPPIAFLGKLSKENIVVLELSSFQLQDLEKSPHIAVILDIKVDHLDYHLSRNEYVEAKRNIVKHQAKNDFTCINADYLTSIEFASSTLGQVWWFSRRKSIDLGTFVHQNELVLRTEDDEFSIIKIDQIQLRGAHNLENIAAAITASFLAGADPSSIQEAVKEFKGLEHRLEFVREIDGVKFYNDSFSTTPETTMAAIRSFDEPIILLLGGSEKNADYQELTKTIEQKNIKLIIPIGGTAKRIVPSIGEIKSMEEAVKIAKEKSSPGEVVLLSPASASFDCFKNYQERGKIFKQEVNQ